MLFFGLNLLFSAPYPIFTENVFWDFKITRTEVPNTFIMYNTVWDTQ